MIGVFRVLHINQQGMTLVEMLVAIAVAGTIAGAVVGAIFQTVTLNTIASDRMVAVRQVQQAGTKVAIDAYQAQTIELTDGQSEYPPGSGFPLNLRWTDLEPYQNPYRNVVRYSINGRDELEREHSVFDGDNLVSHTTGVAAGHIDTLTGRTNLIMRLSDDVKTVLVFTITATVGDHSETRVYEVQPRPHQKGEESG